MFRINALSTTSTISHRLESATEQNFRNFRNSLQESLGRLEAALESECVRRRREKSDATLQLASIDNRLSDSGRELKLMKDLIANVSAIIPWLVEDSYLQILLDLHKDMQETYLYCISE